MKKMSAITLFVAYWSVCAIAVSIVGEVIMGRLNAGAAIGALLCWVLFTIIRVRRKMKLAAASLAIAAFALSELLVVILLRRPLGYGGQAAGILFLVPLILGIAGFLVDLTAADLLRKERKQPNHSPKPTPGAAH